MDYEKLCSQIFKIDPKIRFVAGLSALQGE